MFNLLFGAPKRNDNLNLFLMIFYSSFVNFILSFWWVRIILSWFALKSLFCPLSIHLPHVLSCSPSIDLDLFLHNSSTQSFLFVTDLTPILPYNHVFLHMLNFLSISLLIIYFVFKSNLKRDKTRFMNFILSSIETTIDLIKSLDCDCIFFNWYNFVVIEETILFLIEDAIKKKLLYFW